MSSADKLRSGMQFAIRVERALDAKMSSVLFQTDGPEYAHTRLVITSKPPANHIIATLKRELHLEVEYESHPDEHLWLIALAAYHRPLCAVWLDTSLLDGTAITVTIL
jgi:hypothetical protein